MPIWYWKDSYNAASLIINQLQNKYKLRVFKVNEKVFNDARKLDLIDYESAIELSCVALANFDGIISENFEKFGMTLTPIMSVTDITMKSSLESLINEVDIDNLSENALDDLRKWISASQIRSEMSLRITANTPKIISNSIIK